MTSAKSSVNPFRFTFFRTAKKNWHFPALVSVSVLFLTVIFGIFNEWMLYDSYEGVPFKEWFTERIGRLYYLGETVMRSEFYMAFMMLLAMATGIMIFRYMFSKKAINVYYSLGISRNNLFLSKYLSGAFMLAVAVFVPVVIDVILNLVIFGSTKELWLTVLFYYLGTVLSLLFAYSVAVAVCCRVGTIIEAILYSGVFLVTPVLITSVINFMFRYLLYGSPIFECEWIYGWHDAKNYSTNLYTNTSDYFTTVSAYNTVPFAEVFDYDSELRISSKWYMPDFKSLIPLAILIAAVTLIALATYKKRKTEIAGFLGCDELVKAIAVFVLSSAATCIAIDLFFSYFYDYVWFGICLAAAVFFIIYIAFDIVSIHNFRKILRTLWKYPVHLCAASLVVIIFSTGFFGYSTRLPDKKDVESVSISTGMGDIMMNYDELSVLKSNAGAYDLANYYLLAGFSYQGIVDGISDTDDIGYIIDIHKKFVECKNLKVNDETLNAGYGKRVLPVNIHIIYEMKNGEKFERMYPVATDEIMQMLSEVSGTERYKELAVEYIQKPVPEMVYSEKFDEYYYSSEPVYGLGSVTVESVAYESVTEMPFTFRGSQVMIASPLLSEITCIPQLDGDSELKDGLLNAICSDIKNDKLPLNYRSDADILGYIVFNKYNAEDQNYGFNEIRYQGGTNISPEMTEPVKINVFGGEFRMCFTRRVTVPVYADMSDTVDFLRTNGLECYLEDTVEVSEIRLWVPDDKSVANVYTYDGASMLWSGWWFNTNETCFLIPDSAVSVTDKNEISEITENCTMMCLECYENKYAEIIFEDGSKSYAAIPVK